MNGVVRGAFGMNEMDDMDKIEDMKAFGGMDEFADMKYVGRVKEDNT